MHGADDKQLVCYCVNGHMQIPRGKFAPSNCTICNAPMDVNRMFIPLIPEESETEATVLEPIKRSEPSSLSRSNELSARPPQRMISPAPLVPQSPEPVGVSTAPRRIVRMSPTVPSSIGLTDQQNPAPIVTFQLDYFGEKIIIPEEGGWLGRSAIGENLFEGNMLISREHVRVQPTDAGGLQIGPDHSLNGTYIDNGKGKLRLGSEPFTIDEGAVIWLYNIPLRVERKRQ